MITSEIELLQFLESQEISFERLVHPPVYTCDEAAQYRPDVPAASTKNLFLQDKKGRRSFLVMTACEKRLDLKGLAQVIGVSKLKFGSEEKLQAKLGVTRGAVTVLGLVNDTDNAVELLIDASIWDNDHFLCHPLVNTSTLVISREDMQRFLELTGHRVRVLEIPGRG